VEKDIQEIKVNIAEIKKDLHYHIKRTDALQEMITPIYKFKIFLLYSMSVAALVATILTIRSLL
jgi:hypothetical protein